VLQGLHTDTEWKNRKIFRTFLDKTQSGLTASSVTEKREYNSGSFLSVLDYVKAFDELWRSLLFSILEDKNNPNPLVTAGVKIFENNEIKLKLDPITDKI
jgi:hypothetical protein